MMCKFKARMEKGGHYDVEMKGWMQQGAIIMMCKFKGQMDKGGHDDVQLKGGYKRWHYDVQIKSMDGKGSALRCGNERVALTGGNMMCNLRGWMDMEGHYDVQMKRWISKGAL